MKEPARSPATDWIPGIFNYCDWLCERCSFADRCELNAGLDEEADGEADGETVPDSTSASFVESLEDPLRRSVEMLEALAPQAGVDLTCGADRAEGAARPTEPVGREAVHLDRLALAVQGYAASVAAWMKSRDEMLRGKREEYETQLTLALPGTDPERDARELVDALEEIQIHWLPITSKTMRAISSRRGEAEVDLDGFPVDSDGSAKVALIGIDRSIEAWSRVRRHVPEEEGTILDFLATLERLRREIEARFPNARSFVRPGFDEPEYG